MPRDYSKYRNERPSSRGTYKRRAAAEPSSSGGMVWLLMGVLIGLCLAGFAYLNQNKAHLTEMARNTLVRTAGALSTGSDSNGSNSSGSLASAETNNSKQTVKVAAAQNTANTPQFDFYNMLPAGQVSGPTGDDNSNSNNNTNHQSAIKSAIATNANATSNNAPATAADEAANNAGNNSDNSANNAASTTTNNVDNTAANSESTNKQSNMQTNAAGNNVANNAVSNTAVNNDAVNSNSTGETAAETAESNSLASNEEKALTHGITPPAVATVSLTTPKKSKKLHVIAENTSAGATSSGESATPASDLSAATDNATGSSATATNSANSSSTNADATSASNSSTGNSAEPVTATTTPKSAEYIIQLGAFTRYEEADELKAQLAFSGFEAKIAPYKKGSTTLQRVLMGPYNSLSAAAAVQRQLTDNQMKSTLLKVG